jgi:hypothetical protein
MRTLQVDRASRAHPSTHALAGKSGKARRSGAAGWLKPTTQRSGDLVELQRQYGNQAVTKLLQSQPDHAVQRRDTAERAKPDAADNALWDDMFRLARIHIKKKDYAAAEKLLRGIYGDPKFETPASPGVPLNLGLVRHYQGAFAEAIEFYQESMHAGWTSEEKGEQILPNLRAARLGKLPLQERAPKEDAADVALWDDMFRLARKHIKDANYAAAEKMLMRIYKDPKFATFSNAGTVLNLGLVRHYQGDFGGALSFYNESLHSGWDAESRAQILQNLKAARLKQPPNTGERPKADDADEALWQDMFVLARKRLKAKDYTGAEKLFRQIYADPKFDTAASPGVALNYGLTRHWLGDFAAAISLYEESLHTGWSDDPRGQILEKLRLARLHQPPD